MSRAEQVLDVAQELLDRLGPSALSMRTIAAEVGIRAPSLYRHFPDKAAIEAALQERALVELAAALDAAGSGLPALATAYRRWALAHPHRYRLSSGQALHRDRLSPGVEAAASAPLLAAVGGDPDRARALWGLAHGLVDLELAGRFPADADLSAAWAAGIAAFSQGSS